MKVAVIGASGRGGSRIVAELAQRGHEVTAIARNPDKVGRGPQFTVRRGDLNDVGFPDCLRAMMPWSALCASRIRDPDALIGAVRNPA